MLIVGIIVGLACAAIATGIFTYLAGLVLRLSDYIDDGLLHVAIWMGTAMFLLLPGWAASLFGCFYIANWISMQ